MKFADITADLPADALAAAKEFAIHVIGLPVSHKAYLIGPYVVDKRIRKERGLAVAFYTLLADLMECEFITVDTRSDSDMISKMLTGAAVGGGVAGIGVSIAGALLAAAASTTNEKRTIFLRDPRGISFAIVGDRQLAEYLLPIANGSFERKFTIDDCNTIFKRRHEYQADFNRKAGWGCAIFALLFFIVVLVVQAIPK